jgi:hypothetical protein
MAFARSYNPIWYFVDHVGQSLDDTYYAFFLQNTFPYNPQKVYHDVDGLTEWNNPLEFQPSGTLPADLYFDDSKIYRIEIRAGNSQSDQLVWLIEDYIPSHSSTPGPDGGDTNSTENAISNPQFSIVNFSTTPNAPLFTSTLQTIEIAPGWQIVCEGTLGSVSVSQLLFEGNPSSPTNPSYGLEITSTGWTGIALQQTFLHNGTLWSSQAVAVALTAKVLLTPVRITADIIYSDNDSTTIGTFDLTTSYFPYTDAVQLDPSTNPSVPATAYTRLRLSWPSPSVVDITSIQLVGQEIENRSFQYQQIPLERQDDHLFHYYKNELIIKPKDTILTAWNFSLNPFQFYPTAMTVAPAQTQYIADQTILHQISAGGTLKSGYASVGDRDCLLIKAINTFNDNRFALIQYIDPATIRPYWSYLLSSLARARIFTSVGTANVGIKMRLIWSATLPVQLSNVEPILSWGTDPVFNTSQWNEIIPLNDPTYILPNAYDTSEGTNEFPAFSFDAFQMPAMTTTTMTLGVVIYTTANMANAVGTEDSIAFDRISLVPNKFAVDSNPQTFDQVLRECEYYYETSYAVGTVPYLLPNAITNINSITRFQTCTFPATAIATWYSAQFEFEYRTPKRENPLVLLSAPSTGVAERVDIYLYSGPTILSTMVLLQSEWTSINGTKSICFVPANGTPRISIGASGATHINASVSFHYTSSAVLGR